MISVMLPDLQIWNFIYANCKCILSLLPSNYVLMHDTSKHWIYFGDTLYIFSTWCAI